MVAIAAIAVASSSCSDHRVSPWGARGVPPLGAFVAPPNLEEKLSEIDTETKALGLHQTIEVRGTVAKGGAVVVRGYEGADALGRRTTAVRAATQRGVIMAVGPLDSRDVRRSQPTEIVSPFDAPLRAVGDLSGDGTPDVLLRSETGTLAIWSLEPFGARPYDIDLETPVMQLVDVDGDGRLDVRGRISVTDDDPIAPVLEDVATFDGARYSDATAAARAYHERQLTIASAPRPPGAGRLRRALETAWHAILSGASRDKALAELDKERVDPALRSAFDAHRKKIEKLRPR